MKKNRKKLIALLLSFAMIISLVSVKGTAVFAEEDPTNATGSGEDTQEVAAGQELVENENNGQPADLVTENNNKTADPASKNDQESEAGEVVVLETGEEDDNADNNEEEVAVQVAEAGTDVTVPEEELTLAAAASEPAVMLLAADPGDSGTKEEAVRTVTVTYNGNGADNFSTLVSEPYTVNSEGEIQFETIDKILSKEGIIFDYVFCGWSTKSSGVDPKDEKSYYRPGSAVTLKTAETDTNINLYAVWGEYSWGETLHAKGYKEPTVYTYDGNYHEIKGLEEEPNPDRTTEKGYNYSNGYYYQDLWYSVNAWRYTQFTNIVAGGVDAKKYVTPSKGQVFVEIWWPTDNSWVEVEDTFTQIIPATLIIEAAPLTVKAADQVVKYTGSAITPEGTLEGLVTPTYGEYAGIKETATLEMTPFTSVGKHPITYSIKWDGTAKESNYKVTNEELGTLTIYYQLEFNANGGDGVPADMQITSDSAILPTTLPTKYGYVCVGWATSKDATSPEYKAGGMITLSDNVTLYAVYAPQRVIPIPKTGIDKKVTVAPDVQEELSLNAAGQNVERSYSAAWVIAGLALVVAAIEKKRLSK